MENQTKKVAAASDGSACDLNSVGVGGNGNGLTDGVGVGANSSGAAEEEGIIELHDLRLSPIASLRNRHRPLGGATGRLSLSSSTTTESADWSLRPATTPWPYTDSKRITGFLMGFT